MTKILIIDDEQRLRDNLSEMLELKGYETHLASDGVDGLAMALQYDPEVILCDVMMPNANGYDFLTHIKRTKLSQTPVIMLSAKAERDDQRLGMSLGADDYITKPFLIEEVVGSIEARLNRVEHVKKNITSYSNKSTYELAEIINGHEIRTALNIISGMSLMFDDLADEQHKKQAQQLSQYIQNSIHSITALTNNIYLHELLKSDIEESIFTKSKTDIRKNVTDLSQSMKRKVDIILNGEELDDPFLGYLINYISCELVYNAFKFTPNDGAVRIEVITEKNNHTIKVIDSGSGFNVSVADIKAFTKFHQGADAPGLGLGLHNIKLIAERLQGKLTINQTDEGCCVSVNITR